MSQINTLKYFLVCEYLNPQALEKPEKQQSGNKKVFECSINELNLKVAEILPNLKDYKKADLKLKIVIFAGIFEIDEIKKQLFKLYPNAKDEIESNQYNKAASFILEFAGDELKFANNNGEKQGYKTAEFTNFKTPIVDNNFGLVLDTFKISTTPWALQNFINISRINFNDFLALQSLIIDKISAIKGEDDLQSYVSKICKIVQENIGSILITNKLQVDIIAYKNQNEGQTILNSFFIYDIQKAINLYENSSSNDLLDDFLKENETPKELDLRDEKNLDKILSSFSPNLFCNGAFASKYTLMFSQQFAVNEILKRFQKRDGFYAINGPPGTGKTTLLKELIASIITQRAQILASLDENEILTPIFDNDGKVKLYALNKALCSFEIVVSSSNNGAVENISKELPAMGSIDEKYLKDANYFSEFSSRLMSDKILDTPSWGLICATLGKSANKKDIIFKFLNNSTQIDKQEHEKLSDEIRLEKDGEYRIKGFINYLSDTKVKNFNQVKAEFLSAIKKVNELKNELNLKIKTLKQNENELREIDEWLVKFELENGKNLETDVQKLEKKEQNLRQDREFHFKTKPTFYFLHKLFKTTTFRVFKDKFEKIESELESIKNEVKKAQNLKAKIDQKTRLENEIKILKHSLPKVPENEALREKSSPFMKDENGKKTEFFEARVDVFLKALALHKAAILSLSDKFKKNLTLLRDLFCGSLDMAEFSRENRLKILQTLFFIIPVQTSTFASFGRCFDDFGVGEIGYLLVDEAGQAALPNAIGALMRSRRAIIVGDPLQLEPVVTLPNDLNQILLKLFNTKDQFNLAKSSVQIRADRVEPNGTYIKQNGEQIWLGSPLRVHNRCDNPMFEISNLTTYDNMMIWGKDKNKNSLGLKSRWIDVKSSNFNGNFSPDEADALKNLLQNELQNIPPNDIKIISPFRDVVNNLKAQIPNLRGSIGTIHTMQGKEATLVIFVLGGATNGARAWVASKPNLLNVALTRAKEYIFIIGDKDAYSCLPFFGEAAKLL